MSSQVFNKSQLSALNKIGDLLVPKNNEFPAFSELGCLEYVDEVMEPADPDDVRDLKMLLSVLNMMPNFVIKKILNTMVKANNMPDAIAPLLRTLDIGLRGIIYTLYYSGKSGKNYTGKTPHEIIDFSVVCKPDS